MQTFLKSYATPLVAAVFLALATSGLMMLFGIAGEPVHDLHQWIGGTFIAAVILHVAWNWRSLVVRLRQTQAVVTILLLVLVGGGLIGYAQFVAGAGRQPSPTRQALNALMRAPLTLSAPALGLKADAAVSRLKAKGLTVTGADASLRDVADKSHAELGHVLAALMDASKSAPPQQDGH